MKELFSTIVFVMQQNDKSVFIRELVTLLSSEKAYSTREVDLLLLEMEDVNLKQLLGFEEHKKGVKKEPK